ncbi:ATP-binding protein [Thiohalomonas denitrificans]|uniref:histidine kinase n=1 Tax=Thiohalomonas denitrificans TaxID=415747 RepID=A0A1G5Q990_9GAMM|nr:ATP-binding protein [Thiohalomonas denitrificans]SCZ57829.1 PAS domain S-box-containing protein [Thiohalomonas denitrificans]
MNLEAGKIRVLLVEDDAVDAMLVRRTLSSGAEQMAHLIPAIDLVHAETLSEGIEVLGAKGVDVVLLDLNLGESRGLDTFHRVQTFAPETPIVVLTGLADDEVAVQAIRQGAQDYLIKEDLDFRQLGRALRFALERQRVREARLSLRESERRLSTLMANLPGMAYRCENDEQWTMIFVSEGARELTGYAPEELKGEGRLVFHSLIERDDRKPTRRKVDEALAADRPFAVEYRLRTREGEQRWVMERGRGVRNDDGHLHLEGIILDVTARRQAEKALRRHARRLETLQAIDRDILSAQSADAIALVALTRVGELIPASCCGAVLLYEKDPLRAVILAATKQMVDRFPMQQRFLMTDQSQIAALQAGKSVTISDLREKEILSPLQKELVPLEIRGYLAVPLMVEGELIGSLNIYRQTPGNPQEDDLVIARELADSVAIAIRQSRLFEQVQHYSRELEQRVAERTEELRETNTELEAFTFSVSHDLRNPLANIRGFSDALEDAYGDRLGPEGLEYLHAMNESAENMEQLIEELLAYSRMSRSQIELEPIALEPLFRAAVERERGPGVDATIDIQHPMPAVLGHHTILEQVICNLIGNALKFTRPGVRPEIRVRSETQNGTVRVWVEDNGIGIKPEDQRRIFRVFERANGGYPGTGIGLATVRRGIERLGGRVGVESEPGAGSRFWFELPKEQR